MESHNEDKKVELGDVVVCQTNYDLGRDRKEGMGFVPERGFYDPYLRQNDALEIVDLAWSVGKKRKAENQLSRKGDLVDLTESPRGVKLIGNRTNPVQIMDSLELMEVTEVGRNRYVSFVPSSIFVGEKQFIVSSLGLSPIGLSLGVIRRFDSVNREVTCNSLLSREFLQCHSKSFGICPETKMIMFLLKKIPFLHSDDYRVGNDWLTIPLSKNLTDDDFKDCVAILRMIALKSIDVRHFSGEEILRIIPIVPRIQSKPKVLMLTEWNVPITSEDIARLQPGQYLNDNVVDFYLGYLRRIAANFSSERSIYIFNTQFYPLIKKDAKRAAGRVPKTGINIFDKDFLFIPICESMHWVVIIVCFPGKKESFMMYFDSLGGSCNGFDNKIRNYLRYRWKEEKKSTIILTPKTLPVQHVKAPHQTNGCDCGVFLLHYIEKFLYDFVNSDEDINCQLQDWFNIAEIAAKRLKIIRLLQVKNS